MTWTNPPTIITNWRDALLATPTIQALLVGLTSGQQQARFNYPHALAADFAVGLPMWVLGRARQRAKLLSVGHSFGEGGVEAIGYFASTSDIGTIEGQIQVAHDLVELNNAGNYLYIIEAEVERSSQPSPAQLATADGGQTRTSVPCYTILYMAEWEG